MCVLAAGESLEVGSAALDVFERMCSLPMDLVMLTTVGAPESLTRCLVDNVHNPPPTVTVQTLCSTRLSDAEIQKIEEEKRAMEQQKQQEEEERQKQQQQQQQKQKQQQNNQDGDSSNESERKEGQQNNSDSNAKEEETAVHPEESVPQVLNQVLNLQSSADNPLTTHCDATPEAFAAAGLRYPMYPCQEETFLCDVYGRILDLDDYVVADPDGDAGNDEGGDGARSGGSEADVERADPYTACTVENRQLVVRCQVAFVDMEGRSDGESLASVCTKLAPARLVLLYGRTDDGRRAADALAARCAAALQTRLRGAFVAETGRAVVLEPETQSFRANLSKELLDSVRFESVGAGAYEIAYVAAQAAPPPDGSALVTLVPADPAPQRPDSAWRDTAFVGDLRMDELIQALTARGLRAGFSAGSVIVVNDGAVRIRKEDVAGASGSADDADAQLHVAIEGRLCPDYYRVRDILYDHFKLV